MSCFDMEWRGNKDSRECHTFNEKLYKLSQGLGLGIE